MEVAEVFIACKKEVHYSRELILPHPALVRVVSGEMRIVTAERSYHYFAGDAVLLPRNQLGRMSKLPLDGQPLDAGFENLPYFSFAFKKQFGYNPSGTILREPLKA